MGKPRRGGVKIAHGGAVGEPEDRWSHCLSDSKCEATDQLAFEIEFNLPETGFMIVKFFCRD